MKNNKLKGFPREPQANAVERLRNGKHFSSVVSGCSDVFVTGKFCDVKIVCMDTSLWAHRIILGSVSPYLQKLLVEYEKQGDDVITILLPMIKGYHMKLVLDYIYSGAMYLCGAHMQYVIQVMEVLQLKCGVSVNKIVGGSSGEFIEVEHSTVTIKTDSEQQDLKEDVNLVNGLKEELGPGSYRLRRKSQSTTDCPATAQPKILKTKAVKRKRQSEGESQGESGGSESTEGSADNNNKEREIIAGKLPVTLEITSVSSNSKSSTSSNSSTPSVESPHSTDKPEVKAVDENNLDDEEDEGNDVVMVELDEEFVVEQVDKKCDSPDCSDSSPSNDETGDVEVFGDPKSKPAHRCVLCGRTFKHYTNLQVHLTGHVGVKVNIFMCTICKRKFRNQTELDLHTKSHKFAKMLGKCKVSKEKSGLKAKVISTAGSADKKIIRKYLKGQDKVNVNGKLKQKPNKVPESPKKKVGSVGAAKKADNLTCGLCEKSFGVKSLYLRHVKKAHPELSLALETHSQLKAVAKINIKNCSLPTPVSAPKKVAATPGSPSSPKVKQARTPMRQISTPVGSSSGKKKERTKSDSVSSLVPELPDYYNTLECPDCERAFIAKSIFERHLQSAKHGIYAQCNSSYDSDHLMSPKPGPPGPPVPHWTETPFQSDSGSPHKIECHLCSQTFVRVKDLAKHREKICQAYHSGKMNNV